MIEPSSGNTLLAMKPVIFSHGPFTYKIGNSTFHLQTKFVIVVTLIGLIVLVLLFIALPSYHVSPSNLTNNFWDHGEEHGHGHSHTGNWFTYYNSVYPLTPPIYSARGYVKYRIAIISDLDISSAHPTETNLWFSYLKKGYVTVNTEYQDVASIEWDEDMITLNSSLSYGGRGMELSELVVFNGKLYALDDRTGIIYEIDLHLNRAIPWVIVNDGDGKEQKGLKGEWATVKDETLIVGGFGKEWTNQNGEVVNHNPEWVKTITTTGHIQHHNWIKNYEKLKEADNIHFPGYMLHESCVWSEYWQRWVWLPRRSSIERYNEADDEHKGSNLMLLATEGFEAVKVVRVGDLIPTHGFSSFKFIPGTKDQLIIALKSEEADGKAATFAMAFNMKGKVVFPETKIADYKFEGIEFI